MLIKLLIWPRNKIENRKRKEKINNNSVKDMSECTYCEEQERERKEVIGCEYKRSGLAIYKAFSEILSLMATNIISNLRVKREVSRAYLSLLKDQIFTLKSNSTHHH